MSPDPASTVHYDAAVEVLNQARTVMDAHTTEQIGTEAACRLASALNGIAITHALLGIQSAIEEGRRRL